MLTVGLFVMPSVPVVALDAIETFAENPAKVLLQTFWPFAHGKCFTLDRFDPTCPQCL